MQSCSSECELINQEAVLIIGRHAIDAAEMHGVMQNYRHWRKLVQSDEGTSGTKPSRIVQII
jgi:hypothetical protein